MRVKLALPLLLLAVPLFSQPLYTERLLRTFGLTEDEVALVIRIEEETNAALRRHRADLEVKKAELARLLLENDPSMRRFARQVQALPHAAPQLTERLRDLQRAMTQHHARFRRLVEERETLRDDADLASAIEELQRQLRELQDLLDAAP